MLFTVITVLFTEFLIYLVRAQAFSQSSQKIYDLRQIGIIMLYSFISLSQNLNLIFFRFFYTGILKK